MMDFLGIAIGLLVLLGGGTLLVNGASGLAARLGISPVAIGLTVVAFGTSAPELFVSVIGASRGESGLVFGNVVGSNTANLALILGLSALFATVEIRGSLVRREIPLLLLVTTLIAVMAQDGLAGGRVSAIGRFDAVVLLVLFAVFLFITVRGVLASAEIDPLLKEVNHSPLVAARPSNGFAVLSILAGLVLLFAGSELTIRSAVSFSASVGVAPTLVGLFVVALGTSFPELATSLVAAIRGESDLVVGNVVGSNLFNALIVLPVGALVDPVVIPEGGTADLAVSWLLTAALIPIFILGRARLGRKTGVVLLAVYGLYIGFRLT